ncbi:MAG: hypothetical protein VXW28_08075 [Candidatus Thermoplasmatota archaeon]|nr:hypothetical protein [Candidatus Thermoplasmatota archaeon]
MKNKFFDTLILHLSVAAQRTLIAVNLENLVASSIGVDKKFVTVSLSSGSVRVSAAVKATQAGVQ